MVPTEEERLPVRVPISVRGLSAITFFHGPALRRSLPFASLSYSFFSHFASRWSCFKQGRSLNELSLCSFTRQFCSLNFPYYVRHLLCTFLGRCWLATAT